MTKDITMVKSITIFLNIFLLVSGAHAAVDILQDSDPLNFTASYQAHVLGSARSAIGEPSAMTDPLNSSQIIMWYTNGTTPAKPWYTYSGDGIHWTSQATNIPIFLKRVNVFYDNGTYWLFGTPGNIPGSSDREIKAFYSTDRVNFAEYGTIMAWGGTSWKQEGVANSFVWKEGSTYYMLYDGQSFARDWSVGLASSQNMPPTWIDYGNNPVLSLPSPGGGNVELMRFPNNTPYRSVDGRYYLYYIGGLYQGGTGLAYSPPNDFHNWTNMGKIVHGGTEQAGWSYTDPTFIEFNNRTYMFNTPSNQVNIAWIDMSVSDVHTGPPSPTQTTTATVRTYAFGGIGYLPVMGDWKYQGAVRLGGNKTFADPFRNLGSAIFFPIKM